MIGRDILSVWCLLLTLLKEGLIASLLLHDGSGKAAIAVSLDRGLQRNARGVVSWRDAEAALRITPDELEHWTHFFLKYWRDGVADVPHIDVDIPRPARANTPGLFLVLHASEFAPAALYS